MSDNLYKIDKNVPFPETIERHGRGVSTRTATVMALKPGESFFLPKSTKQKGAATARELQSSVNYVRKTYPERKYLIRTVTENRQQGARIWRRAETNLKWNKR